MDLKLERRNVCGGRRLPPARPVVISSYLELIYMDRYASQRSRTTLSAHRVKNGMRNILAKDVVANIVWQAGDAG